MPASVGPEIAESRRNHAHEPFAVGAQGVELDLRQQAGVPLADARAMQVDVHAAQLVDQAGELSGCVVARDVQRFRHDLFGGCGAERLERLFSPSCCAYAPSFADAQLRHFEPYARCGAYDDDTFHTGRFLMIHLLKIRALFGKCK